MANAEHRAEVARLWGVPSVPAKAGKTAVEMFDAVRAGEIKALWIACTNPAQSMPHLESVRAALERAEIVVLQEAFRNTDTAHYADLLLPATTWGEKDGVVTNSERRITRVRAAVPPPGEARHDWDIAAEFARRLGRVLDNPLAPTLFPYTTSESIFNEHRETTRGRDLDITGLSYELLAAQGPQQWPFAEGATTGRARLYEDGVYATPSGRAHFANVAYQPTAEATDAHYPLHLTTGRLRDQWHGMSRTGTIAQLFNHTDEPLLSMHASDMKRRGLSDGDVVNVTSRRGALALRVAASPEVYPGQAFIPMHWGGQFMNGAGVNALTIAAFDPISKQPELKHTAVEVERLALPHRVVAMRRFAAVDASAGQEFEERLRSLLPRFDYGTLGQSGRDDRVVVLRGYAASPIGSDVLDILDQLLLLDEADKTMRYVDAGKSVEKAARIDAGVVQSVCLSGETAAQQWLKNMMVQGASADAVRPWILAPVATPPRGTLARGRIVCNCVDVAESEILARVAAGDGFAEVQAALKCGSECGSCLPELRRLCVR
jgi:assimilatory nitrate reductase catalytic subunit